jgi:hypothetical protein
MWATMTRRIKGKHKPTNMAGKDASARGRLKSKQTRADNVTGTGSTGPQNLDLLTFGAMRSKHYWIPKNFEEPRLFTYINWDTKNDG